MQHIEEIIEKFDKKFSLDYYNLHFKKITNNIAHYPDISIESCKSLIEGILKTIILYFDPNFYNVNDLSVSKLVNTALNFLSDFCPEITQTSENKSNKHYMELSLIKHISDFAHVLGNIRSDRGDISHGKAAPKILTSDAILARSLYLITEGIVFYILHRFFEASLKKEEFIIIAKEYDNDDYEQFNEFLDNQYPLDCSVRYSKALYVQDHEAYIEQYRDFEVMDDE